MTRVTLALALLCAIALASPAASQHPENAPTALQNPENEQAAGGVTAPAASVFAVTIGFDAMRPSKLDIVTGESVKWTNESARTHTVTADDESFDSGRLGSSAAYNRRFAVAGDAPYHCRLHPSIRGVVGVHDLLLGTPGQVAAPNRPFVLAGRTALPAATPVSIEADSGAGFAEVGSAEVGDDGRFSARLVPATTASYRAVAGSVTSPPVRLLVLDRRISVTARRAMDGRVRLHAKVTPASRGGRVVLQLYLPERFGWWPVRQARLGRDSSVTFTVRTERRLRARVRYTLADGATALATSPVVRLRAAGAHRAR